jgi:hypothetical protein
VAVIVAREHRHRPSLDLRTAYSKTPSGILMGEFDWACSMRFGLVLYLLYRCRSTGRFSSCPMDTKQSLLIRSSSPNAYRCSPLPASPISIMKARQSAKIRELRQILLRNGYVTLDQQAGVLGLSRSSAWAVLNANHKCSGLSAKVLNRILASRHLPTPARTTLLEYIDEKITGLYGHRKERLRVFRMQTEAAQSLPIGDGRTRRRAGDPH